MELADKGTPAELARAINPNVSWQKIEELAERIKLAIERKEIKFTTEEFPWKELSPRRPEGYVITKKLLRVAMLADAAEWAHKHGFQLDPQLAHKLSLQSPSLAEIENSKGKNTKRQPEPRDSTLKEVLAATALAFGYDPTSGEKAAQGKLKAIASKCNLDEGTVSNAIKNAIRSTRKKSDTQS